MCYKLAMSLKGLSKGKNNLCYLWAHEINFFCPRFFFLHSSVKNLQMFPLLHYVTLKFCVKNISTQFLKLRGSCYFYARWLKLYSSWTHLHDWLNNLFNLVQIYLCKHVFTYFLSGFIIIFTKYKSESERWKGYKKSLNSFPRTCLWYEDTLVLF